jgi:endonuclease/exonuclease/phosphatase family metal-dependent hydrolase
MKRTTKLLACAVLAAAGSIAALVAAQPSRRSPIDAPAELTVATYNMNFGLEADPECMDALEAIEADVVLLQETTPGWERAIRAALSDRYPHMWFVHEDDWPAGGQAILSRYELTDFEVSESPAGYFVAGRATAHAPSGDVALVNVHLKPPISDSGSWVAGYFETPPVRAEEMRAHAAKLFVGGMPVIVAGDFNESEGGGLEILEGRGMRSALPEFSGATTWRWPFGPFTLRRTMDHIVYDPAALECLDARAIQAGRSDHVPVVAKFRRPGSSSAGAP